MRAADVMQEGLFALGGLYSPFGRESIPPEKLLRALMLQVLFGVRSGRQPVEPLRYNMLYRWFVGLPLHEQPWDHSSFTRNLMRLVNLTG